MKRNNAQCAIKKTATAVGAGLMAGFAGTVAITISQMIEMKITGRTESTAPADAVEKTLEIKSKPGTKKKLAHEVHWTYGTLWGAARGLFSLCGMNKWLATTAHFSAITGTALAIAPLEGREPVKDWPAKELAIDLLHHSVYAIVAGLVYDRIMDDDK